MTESQDVKVAFAAGWVRAWLDQYAYYNDLSPQLLRAAVQEYNENPNGFERVEIVPAPTTPEKRKYQKRKLHVVGAKIGKNRYGSFTSKNRDKLWTAIKTILAENGQAMMPKEVKARIERDARYKRLLLGEPAGLVSNLMFYRGHTPNAEIRRVPAGYELSSRTTTNA